MKYGLMLALGLVLPQIRAQVVEEERNASALFGGGAVGESHPNVDLPKQVIAPEGKLSLYADYEHVEARGIPMYLVNRSGKSVVFSSQDGDIYIKLEHQKPDGKWQRAQAHLHSFCGNSYGQHELATGQHYSLFGYRPQKGVAARVRYACYGNVEVISNVGDGCYLPGDVSAAAGDVIAMRDVRMLFSWLMIDSFKTGVLTEGDEARWELVLVSLELARVLGGDFGLEKKAVAWRELLLSIPSQDKHLREVIEKVDAVLERPWNLEMDRERLVDYCVKALSKGPDEGNVFGNPANFPSHLWSILGDFSSQTFTGYAAPKSISKRSWRAVLELAAQRVMQASEVDQYIMIDILGEKGIGNECLSDAVFESFLVSQNQTLVKVSANVLSRRGQWERLTSLGWKLPPENQITVLTSLVCPDIKRVGLSSVDEPGRGIREPLRDSDEERFWKHCMSSQPQKCAREWQNLFYFVYPDSLPLVPYLRSQLLIYLTSIADQDGKRAEEFEMKSKEDYTRDVFGLLVPRDGFYSFPIADENEEEQTEILAVLRRLLSHSGYRSDKGYRLFTDDPSSDFEEYHFIYREEARDALKRLGENVPEGLEFRREVRRSKTSSDPTK